jgi:hypothetical protein
MENTDIDSIRDTIRKQTNFNWVNNNSELVDRLDSSIRFLINQHVKAALEAANKNAEIDFPRIPGEITNNGARINPYSILNAYSEDLIK